MNDIELRNASLLYYKSGAAFFKIYIVMFWLSVAMFLLSILGCIVMMVLFGATVSTIANSIAF